MLVSVAIFTAVFRAFISNKTSQIKQKLTKKWDGEERKGLEIKLVINTVAFAILNPG
jgi:hypothetical protein